MSNICKVRTSSCDKQNVDKMEEKKARVADGQDPNWPKVFCYTCLQILMLFGLFLVFTETKFVTLLFSIFLTCLAVLGTTAGSHRLWAHNSYAASTPLKIFLMLCQTLAGQGTIYDWVLLHRIHHQHHKTELDPFNPNKGFLHAHILNVMLNPNPKLEMLKTDVDTSDLEEDGVVMFQKRYYWFLMLFVFAIFPITIPVEYWGETLLSSVFVAGWLRYALSLHLCWLIHSGIKIWGLEKGEKYPSDTNMIFFITANHWISYHYLTPWDYQTGEYGSYGTDATSAFVRVCAALGHATDLRTLDKNGVQQALYLWADTKKPVSECLLEAEKMKSIPKDHFLQRSKYL